MGADAVERWRRYGGPVVRPEPVTDPHGFPTCTLVPGRVEPARTGLVDRRAAGALAGAYAVDYLSWDETDPDRRGRALAEYLPGLALDPARLGWTGLGRQRADFALPGPIRPDHTGGVLVEVRVRVTPYRRVDSPPNPTPPVDPPAACAGVMAAASAPTARGWRASAARWVRITVPVVAIAGGQLAVDVWDEALDLHDVTVTARF